MNATLLRQTKKMSQTEEKRLLELAKQGNQLAFQAIVKQHQKHLAITIKGMLGNVSEVDDVGQETFIRFYKSIHQFKGNASLKTYLTRIAINLSLNALKKRKKQYERFETGAAADLKMKLRGVESSDRSTDINDLVHQALNYVDPKFRSVLVLRMLEGYSTKETADILEIPLGTVLSRLNTAQKKLKEVILKLNPDIH